MTVKESTSKKTKPYNEILELLNQVDQVELNDVNFQIGELEFSLLPPRRPIPISSKPSIPSTKPKHLLEEKFIPPIMQYSGEIVEVKIGATKKEGGSRDKSLIIGGEKVPAYYLFEKPLTNKPVISIDVFDTKIPLASPVRMHVEDVAEDPAAWAQRAVKKWHADMVNVHLVSIDPLVKDTSPKKAAKTIEEVLQSVKVPIAVGGCGDPEKDLKVFQYIAEMFSGERLLFNSVTLDMDIKKTAEIIKNHGHTVIAFTSMDMDKARELNRKLYEYLPKEDIVIDTTTAALGYGLDYAFTVMERTRLASLMGDIELQHPLSSGTTNAWAAREAWMKMDEKWGGSDFRGPIWETVTAITLVLAGVDFFMMMHPSAVKTVQEVIEKMEKNETVDKDLLSNWIGLKIN
jgi:acetyl-CoA decarbonylase/synthase complex subunit delta